MTVRLSDQYGNPYTVDANDAWLVRYYRWYRDSAGYLVAFPAQFAGGALKLHRLILGVAPREIVDHIDGDRSNNSRGNLRICTIAQNALNKPKPKNNTSGYKGVEWCAAKGVWTARIAAGGKRKRIGVYPTREAAALAYAKAARELHGEFVRESELIC